jgi:hypothetical protein
MMQLFKSKQNMDLKIIKKLLVCLSVLALTQNCKVDVKSVDDNEETYYLYDTCVLPFSSGVICKSELQLISPPMIIIDYLDSVILQEKNCPCYRGISTGFDVMFSVRNGKKHISFEPIRRIYIGDYTDYFGIFVHKNHYFFCRGDLNTFNLNPLKKIRVYSFYPKEINAIRYLGYSLWNFECDDSCKVYSKIICH